MTFAYCDNSLWFQLCHNNRTSLYQNSEQTTVGLPPSLPPSLSLYLFLLSSLAFFLSCPRRRQSPIAHNDYVLGGRAVGLAERRGDGTKAAEGEEREGGGRGGRLGRVLSPLLSKLVNVMRPPPPPPPHSTLTLPSHPSKRICL